MGPGDFLGVPLGCLRGPGLPRGAGGLKETTQATQNGLSAAEAHSFLKTPKNCLRRNVHAVEARSPYWLKEGAGRTRITTARRKVQIYAQTHVVKNVYAVGARSPF